MSVVLSSENKPDWLSCSFCRSSSSEDKNNEKIVNNNNYQVQFMQRSGY